MTSPVGEGVAVRPFRVDVPEEDLLDLRRRILATRWPERETVADESQGVQLATIQELARYWATDYDWRKCEAKLNALPGTGHWVAEQAPEEMVAALTAFLAPHLEGGGGSR
jgi:hypothetical protein